MAQLQDHFGFFRGRWIGVEGQVSSVPITKKRNVNGNRNRVGSEELGLPVSSTPYLKRLAHQRCASDLVGLGRVP
jgi:hypothetical protein